MRTRRALALASLACLAFAAPRAEAGTPLTITADRAVASAAVENAIRVVVPAKVKAGKSFRAGAAARFDKRAHKPPYDYLKAGLFSTKGTTACPRSVPIDRRGWDKVVTHDYDPGDSVRVEFSSRVTLDRPGRYRFCAYVYVARPSRTIGSFTETLHTKARASKLVRAQAA